MNGFGSFGQYVPFNTPIHRMDTRVKLFLLVVFMVAIFLPYGNRVDVVYPYAMSLVVLGGIFVLLMIGLLISRISFGSLMKSMSFLWVLLLVVIILNFFFWKAPDWASKNSQLLFVIGKKEITSATFLFIGYIIARIFLMVILSLMFASTTKPMDMTFALEWYLTPLRWLHVPTAAFSMTMSLALRFIPVLASEAKTIFKAQAARGLDYSNGKAKDRIKAIVSLLIPLITTSFHHASELAYALEARGYDPLGKRTRYRQYPFRFVDVLWLIFGCVALASSLFFVYFQVDGSVIDIFKIYC